MRQPGQRGWAVQIGHQRYRTGFAQFGASGTCTLGTGTCECDISISLNQVGSEPYTYSNGVLTTTQTRDVFESCITEPSLRYRDVGDGGTIGVFGLTRVGSVAP